MYSPKQSLPYRCLEPYFIYTCAPSDIHNTSFWSAPLFVVSFLLSAAAKFSCPTHNSLVDHSPLAVLRFHMTLRVTEPEMLLCGVWDTEVKSCIGWWLRSLQIVLFQDAKAQGNWRCSLYIHTKETRVQYLLDKSLDGPQNWFRHCDGQSNVKCSAFPSVAPMAAELYYMKYLKCILVQ